MRIVYNGGMLVERTPVLPFRASYFKWRGNNSFTLWSGTQRLKLNVIEHYPTCKVVMNFLCSLQNEKGLLDKIPPKSQGCIYCLRSGILQCLHTFPSLALVALRTIWNINVLCKWCCLVTIGYLLWYKAWIRITWSLNHKMQNEPPKATPFCSKKPIL